MPRDPPPRFRRRLFCADVHPAIDLPRIGDEDVGPELQGERLGDGGFPDRRRSDQNQPGKPAIRRQARFFRGLSFFFERRVEAHFLRKSFSSSSKGYFNKIGRPWGQVGGVFRRKYSLSSLSISGRASD